VVRNVEDAVAAVHRVPELDRCKVRRVFEERFTSKRMAQDYLAIYSNMIEVAKTAPVPRLVTEKDADRQDAASKRFLNGSSSNSSAGPW
jgi:hypothetical protein